VCVHVKKTQHKVRPGLKERGGGAFTSIMPPNLPLFRDVSGVYKFRSVQNIASLLLNFSTKDF